MLIYLLLLHSSQILLLSFIPFFSCCLFFPVLSSGYIPLTALFFLILLQPPFSCIPVVSSNLPIPHNFHIKKYSTNFSHSYCSSHSCLCMKCQFSITSFSNQHSNAILFNYSSELISHELTASHKHSPPNSFH